jgi:hypothetical protein
MKKKNILAENMKRFGTKNLSEQEEYQSLGQQGEMPKLDPRSRYSAFVDQLLSSLANRHMSKSNQNVLICLSLKTMFVILFLFTKISRADTMKLVRLLISSCI